ncbi:MAG: hypothetical protein ACKVP5_18925 [Aestuariivirga sp.]
MLYPFELDTDYIAELPDVTPDVALDSKLVSYPAIAGLTVHLIDQSEENFGTLVTVGMLRDWRVDKNTIFSDAVSTLEKQLVPKSAIARYEYDDGAISFVEGAGDYNASLLLSGKLWDHLSIDATSLAVGIPHRARMCFVDAASKPSLQLLGSVVSDTFEDEEFVPKHLLSNQVLFLDDSAPGCWAPKKTKKRTH